jgi:hypothetical protein
MDTVLDGAACGQKRRNIAIGNANEGPEPVR